MMAAGADAAIVGVGVAATGAAGADRMNWQTRKWERKRERERYDRSQGKIFD